jgi:adenylate kinase family enzyme
MRILIIGTSCAGKSAFARVLGSQTGLRVIELDALYWGPQWMPRESAEFRRLVADATAGDAWIVVGNYGTIRDVLWPRATTAIWLNYAFATVFWRALRRTIRRTLTREELWNGNRESLRRSFFSRESILWWIITTHRRRREEFAQLRVRNEYPSLTWVEFLRPTDAVAYLRTHQVRAPLK